MEHGYNRLETRNIEVTIQLEIEHCGNFTQHASTVAEHCNIQVYGHMVQSPREMFILEWTRHAILGSWIKYRNFCEVPFCKNLNFRENFSENCPNISIFGKSFAKIICKYMLRSCQTTNMLVIN
jgi:hypothetical protein